MAKRFLIVSDTYGSGDAELGRILMKNFLYSLARAEDKPAAVMLANSGVKLACAGSDAVDDLRLLQDAGVQVKACGTCLDFLGLTQKLAVGDVSTMPQAVGALVSDEQIVTIA